MPQLPSAVFFDLDDTLIDFSSSASRCWTEVCDDLGSELLCAVAELLPAIEAHRQWYWSDAERSEHGRMEMNRAYTDIVSGALERCGVSDASLAERLASRYMERRFLATALFPEAVETLTYLRRENVRLAMITNGHPIMQRPKIDRFALAPYFDCIIVEGEFGVGKPHAEVFRHALRVTGAQPESAWMVGDNLQADIAGAQQVGIHAIWRDVLGQGLPRDARVRPDRTIRSLSEVFPVT